MKERVLLTSTERKQRGGSWAGRKPVLPAKAKVTKEKPWVANMEPSEVTHCSLWSLYMTRTRNHETTCTQLQSSPPLGAPFAPAVSVSSAMEQGWVPIFQKQWLQWPLALHSPTGRVSGDGGLGLGRDSRLGSQQRTLTPCRCGHWHGLLQALQTQRSWRGATNSPHLLHAGKLVSSLPLYCRLWVFPQRRRRKWEWSGPSRRRRLSIDRTKAGCRSNALLQLITKATSQKLVIYSFQKRK